MSRSETLFRHRSSLLLSVVYPISLWAVGPRAPEAPEAALGVALVALGGALRLASVRCLGRGARVHRADARGGLVSWGPYSWSRNPLYVAAALILTGFALVTGGGWPALLLLPATLLAYTPVVLHEEGVIRASVGPAFDAYRGRVSRWIGLPQKSHAGERAPWGEVLRREVGLGPGLALGLAAIALARAGWLPVAQIMDYLVQASHLPVEALCALGLGGGALINSLGIERKRRRHEARREQQALMRPPQDTSLSGVGNPVAPSEVA